LCEDFPDSAHAAGRDTCFEENGFAGGDSRHMSGQKCLFQGKVKMSGRGGASQELDMQ
jgi:hypothetical protein